MLSKTANAWGWRFAGRAALAGIAALALLLVVSILPAGFAPVSTVEAAYASTNGAIPSNGEVCTFKARYGGKMLDVPSSSSGESVQLQTWGSNGLAPQRFCVRKASGGAVSIQAACSGKYLMDMGGRVVQRSSANTKAQRWHIVKSGAYVAIKNAATGRCITVSRSGNGVKVTTAAGRITDKQRFTKSGNQHVISDGEHIVWNHIGGLNLDVKDGSKRFGANVQIFSNNGTRAQKWIVRHEKNGFYRITNAGSNQVLTAASKSNGANVIQHARRGDLSLWYAKVCDDGGMALFNKASGKVLDVQNGVSADGQNVRVWEYNGSAAQRWTFA